MPILICEKGLEKGLTLSIEPGKGYVCGRDPASTQIVLNDVMTSRRHFEIRAHGDGFLLQDLGSRNGTYLNDEAITEPMPLKIGDKIQVGDTMFSFLTDRKEETPQGLVGKTVGGYKILERIGRGGMGTVFKANQLSLNRDVALKVLGARLLKDPDFVERFQNEARAAGQLNHPNLVQVYDVGASQGLHYFSMEFMENGSVQDHLGKDERVPWAEALDMMIDAARGLVFAERNAIVHRDIKPDNLMVSTDGSVKIGDLGLATRKEDGGNASAKGAIFGTPHFISPEQAQGLEVGHAADLYSLGATFYRILSGRTPFLGEQVQAIIRQQIVEEPPPLRELVPDVPQAVAGVITRLMKKDPADRYPSAADLVEELEAIRVTHHPAMRAGRKGRRALGAAAAVVILGIVGYFIFGPKSEPPKPPEKIFVPGTTNGTVQNPNAEQAAELRRSKAKTAWLEVTRDAPDNGRVTEANHASAAWDEFLTALRVRVIEPYGDTPAAGEAIRYRDGIVDERRAVRERIEKRTREAEKRREAVRASWRTLEEAVLGLVAKKRFTAALEAWEKAAAKRDLLGLPETKDDYLDLEGRILDEARNHANAMLGEVDRLEASGDLTGALGKLETFLGTWNQGHRRNQVFTRVEVQAEVRRTRLREAIKKIRLEDLSHDFDAFLVAYRSVRRLDAEGPDDTNHVFRYDFQGAATALAKWLAGDAGLRTWPYRGRLERKIADLERMERFMLRLVEAVRSGEATSMDIRVHGMGALMSKGGRILSIDREGIRAEFGRGAVKATLTKAFELFTPRQFCGSILLHGRRIPLQPRDRLDLALLLAEIGTHDCIAPVLEGLGPVDALPENVREDAKAVLAYLAPERRAAVEYDAILTAWRRSNHTAASLVELDQRRRKFEETHARTDLFLLIKGSPPARLGLVPDDEVKRFLDGR